MDAPLVSLVVSGSMVILLITFFRYEQTHGVRFARGIRTVFDRSLEGIGRRMGEKYRHLTGQTIRQSVHYIFHQILTGLLRTIHRMEAYVRSVVRVNKKRANRRKTLVQTPHFSAIADHKRSTRLSDVQKQQKRDQALMGR